VLYAAKCFWPGVTEEELLLAADRAGSSGEDQTAFCGALYLPADEIVLSLFESHSSVRVKRACEAAGMPCERVIETLWVAPGNAHSRPVL
jgi:hypothetical protein